MRQAVGETSKKEGHPPLSEQQLMQRQQELNEDKRTYPLLI